MMYVPYISNPLFPSSLHLLSPISLWITLERPELAGSLEIPLALDRLQRSWPSSATGLKLTLFQVRFLLTLPQWSHEYAGVDTTDADAVGSAVLRMYDALGGRPTQAMIESFAQQSRQVQAAQDFGAFFQGCGLAVDSAEADRMLRDAMRRSEELGYHGDDPGTGGGGGGGGGRGAGGGGRGGRGAGRT
ncbi:hypothetical protein B484DRAFT_248146 [Ochromonadaceae sp. CCMP2298]|nr:hypothetical protein B484DRAFT_248146 [Ochromonadaceae sp. CCMP2298]